MRRREFITLLGGAAATWPLTAHAQQAAMPVVGMLNGQSADSYSHLTAAFLLGLKDVGFVEGQNVLIEYRWAEGHDERLPAMAVELVNRQVAALVTGGSIWSTISAKAATSTIPIIFTTGSDPVKLGFVTSLNRPGGNVTGVSFLAAQLIAKRVASDPPGPNHRAVVMLADGGRIGSVRNNKEGRLFVGLHLGAAEK